MDETQEQVDQAATDAAEQSTESGVELADLTDPGAIAKFFEDNADLISAFVAKAAGAIVLLIIALFIARIVGGLTRRALDKANLDTTLSKFFAKLARWGVLLLFALAALSIFGIETASFGIVLGSAGLAIGLAFQGTLSNFAAGVMLLVFRPFKVGQVVDVGGVKGKVDEIGIFTTTLDTPDNRRLILPNGSVFGATIENVSHHATRRVDVAVGCDYSADIDTTRGVLMKAATETEGRLQNEDVAVVLLDLGASSVDWSVRVWANSADYWGVRQALTRQVKMHLDQAGIGIPFPQMDVHLPSADALG